MKVLFRKTLINLETMIRIDLVPANFVPAAAVKREGQVLFQLTGHKGLLGGKLL